MFQISKTNTCYYNMDCIQRNQKPFLNFRRHPKAKTILTWMGFYAVVFFILHNLAEVSQTAGCIRFIFLRRFSLAFEGVLCVSLFKQIFTGITVTQSFWDMLPKLKITDFNAFIASSPLWHQIICAQYESLISLKGSIFSWRRMIQAHTIPSKLCPRVNLGSR